MLLKHCCWWHSPLFNSETSNPIQKRHPYTENLNSETSGNSRYAFLHCGDVLGDPLDPEMEPDTAQQESQEAAADQEEEEEEEGDPAVLAKKQKQLAKRGVTFEAKIDPKVCP